MDLNKRDLRFDSLRGLMLVCMTVNHLPSALRVLTDQSLGLFSAAEGFIFLSGLMAGWIYTRKLRKDGPEALLGQCRRRTGMIYGWHIAGFLASFVLVRAICLAFGFCSPSAPQVFYRNPMLALLLGVMMLHQPGLLDILPLYCIFFAALPFALRALEAGRALWVLVSSALLWFAVQWAPAIDSISFYPINFGSFNPFAWQFLFLMGVLAGRARLDEGTPVVRARPILIVGCSAVLVIGWGIQHLGWRPDWTESQFGVSLNKPALGALRLANFAAAAYFVTLAGGRFPRTLTWAPLAFLGRHSLAVVSAQSVLEMVLLEFPALFATPLANTVSTAAAIAFLFAAAAAHEAWQRRKRQPQSGPLTRRSPTGAAALKPAG